GDYVSDDELAIGPLRELGWDVETVSWRDKNADWEKYEAVILRTPWDYHEVPDEFLDALKKIEAAGTRLENSLEIVKWNLNKTYLQELEERGVLIVPTIWGMGRIDENIVNKWFQLLGADEIIIKPVISATARHTYRIRKFLPELTAIFENQDHMVQPFMKNIVEEGEFSLFYFGSEFSHAILKSPKQDDFRVQEEWGGIIKAVEPDEKILEAGENALNQIGQKLLYARVGLVRTEDDEFALMELELIEPSLYFRMDKSAPKRFAEAFDKWMR
ncbi:MAG: hypothetical protein KDB79_15035, partial [Acidobacteria bacterium]|nr:hypothetical protein [Acidobacteriota bacterium]